MRRTVVIGHGRSPEGRGWGHRIDKCDAVVRMWDWAWQDATDYGEKYDYGFFEIHSACFGPFKKYNRRNPVKGWVGSALGPVRVHLPPHTHAIDQKRWTDIGRKLGGLGKAGQLRFTRGTIAACWAIETSDPGDHVVLVGFDNIHKGVTLPLDEAFSPAYQANPGTWSFNNYRGGVTKAGNHDFAIERPVLEHLAERHDVRLSFAQDIWMPLRALILGDADCVNEDARAALEMFTPDAVFAVNNIGIHWPGRLDYWCTLHASQATDWVGIHMAMLERRRNGGNRPETWGYQPGVGIDKVTNDWGGGSGLFAVHVALEEGFTNNVLAGIPMSPERNHFYSNKPWHSGRHYRERWRNHHAALKDTTRSMSGWTREWLGEPDEIWLNA